MKASFGTGRIVEVKKTPEEEPKHTFREVWDRG